MSNNSKNATRHSCIYNGEPIESCIWSIERHHFQWTWTTPNCDVPQTRRRLLRICAGRHLL